MIVVSDFGSAAFHHGFMFSSQPIMDWKVIRMYSTLRKWVVDMSGADVRVEPKSIAVSQASGDCTFVEFLADDDQPPIGLYARFGFGFGACMRLPAGCSMGGTQS